MKHLKNAIEKIKSIFANLQNCTKKILFLVEGLEMLFIKTENCFIKVFHRYYGTKKNKTILQQKKLAEAPTNKKSIFFVMSH
jgi:hypothetical protein